MSSPFFVPFFPVPWKGRDGRGKKPKTLGSKKLLSFSNFDAGNSSGSFYISSDTKERRAEHKEIYNDSAFLKRVRDIPLFI